LAVAAGVKAAPANLTAAQIVEKHVAARGGLQAWRAVQTMSLAGQMDAGNGDSAERSAKIAGAGLGASVKRQNNGATPAAGANGLTLDRQKRLLLAAGGDRAILRLEKNGTRTAVAERYEGKRIGCPNDLASRSDGGVYFTDSGPGCIPGGEQNAELPFHGVYFAKNGKLRLLDQDPGGYPPNGIALSANEKILYATNGGPIPQRRQIFAYDVQPDGSLTNKSLFLNATTEPGEDAWDGLKVDRLGNVYASGPGGLWIISPEGKHLGTVVGPEHPHNLAWGGEDRKTLYLAAQTGLYRISVNIPGAGQPQ